MKAQDVMICCFLGLVLIVSVLNPSLRAGAKVLKVTKATQSFPSRGTSGPKMMGYHTAFSNLGRIVTKLLAGDLASYGWSLPFNVYWIGPSCLAPSSHSSDMLRHKNKGASNYLEAPFRLCMDYR